MGNPRVEHVMALVLWTSFHFLLASVDAGDLLSEQQLYHNDSASPVSPQTEPIANTMSPPTTVHPNSLQIAPTKRETSNAGDPQPNYPHSTPLTHFAPQLQSTHDQDVAMECHKFHTGTLRIPIRSHRPIPSTSSSAAPFLRDITR